MKPHQPRVIGLDIYHDFEFAPNLAAELVANKQFIAACEIGQTGEEPNSIASPPSISSEQLGFTDLPLDPDYVIRRQLILMNSTPSCNTFQSLSLRIALDYLAQLGENSGISKTSDGHRQIGDLTLTRFQANAGGYQLAPAEALGYQILINYRSSEFPQVSLRNLLNNSLDSQIADLVHNRIVLIGVDKRSQDSHLTPYSKGEWPQKIPGVKIHAHNAAQIISAVQGRRPLLWWWSEWSEILWIGSWSMVGGLLVLYWHKPLQLLLAVSSALAMLDRLCFCILLQGGWVPLVPSAFTLMATSACLAILWTTRRT